MGHHIAGQFVVLVPGFDFPEAQYHVEKPHHNPMDNNRTIPTITTILKCPRHGDCPYAAISGAHLNKTDISLSKVRTMSFMESPSKEACPPASFFFIHFPTSHVCISSICKCRGNFVLGFLFCLNDRSYTSAEPTKPA